jgi:ankyrin repeat protein
MAKIEDPVSAFIEAACVPLDASHASGTLDLAESLLAAHPEIATANIHTAAILGDHSAVGRFIAEDRSNATLKGGPRNWDALTHLCFSRYLRLDRSRSMKFLKAATALLDAGADANTGWFENNHQPAPEWESALYGAAGVAHNADLTRLLLEHGANPNDGEVTYHVPETYDNDALEVLVNSGNLTADSLATLLLRKSDWHDYDGIAFLVENDADPDRHTHWGNTALQHAVLRDNSLAIIELLLRRGGNPLRVSPPHKRPGQLSGTRSSVEIAAWRGRRDVLDLFEERGFPIKLPGVAGLIAACARDNPEAIAVIAAREPNTVKELLSQGGRVLSMFAGVGNVEGMRQLLSLGVGVDDLFVEGEGYYGVARNSRALHVAAWRARHEALKMLLEQGANVDAPDGDGRTPLALAVKACVDSYWTERRTPESVKALLDAGASTRGVAFPSGYKEVDDLMEPHLTK